MWADFERTMPHSDSRGLHLNYAAALLNLRATLVREDWHPETRLLPDLADRADLASVHLAGRSNDERGLGALYPAVASGTAAASRSRIDSSPRPCARLSVRPITLREPH
ncbi:hypothetical protein [Streptomyces bobili]